jgi:SAM-dependent methyltransferase
VVDVLHEIEDHVTFLANLGRALKPGGLIGIVDFKPGGAGPGPGPEDRVPPEDVEREAARAGLVLRRRETFLPFQYSLVFGRQETTAAPGAGASSARTRGAAPARPRP